MDYKEFSIAVAGSQWITQFLVEKLHASNLTPSLLISMGNEWSDRISGYSDLGELSCRIGAEIYHPASYKLDQSTDIEALKKYDIDLLIVFGWQRLIPKWLIDKVKFGVWGVHGGPEPPPRCRGQAVFNWALILGYERFFMYMFKITPGVDDGPIGAIAEFSITPQDDVLTLYHKNCLVSSDIFVKSIPKIFRGQLELAEQEDGLATYCPKRSPENGGINWKWPAAKIENLIRGLAPPYPGAFSFLCGERVFFSRAQVFDQKIKLTGQPGQIIETFPNGDFLVMAADEALYVRDWRFENNGKIEQGLVFDLSSGVELEDPII